MFEQDLVLIPVNVEMEHWYLVACFMRELRIQRFDSSSGIVYNSDIPLPDVTAAILAWFQAAARYTNNTTLKPSMWTVGSGTGSSAMTGTASPKQATYWDCGVFTCFTMDRLSLRSVCVMCAAVWCMADILVVLLLNLVSSSNLYY